MIAVSPVSHLIRLNLAQLLCILPTLIALGTSSMAHAQEPAPPPTTELYQRLQLVEHRIERIEEDMPGLGGPITMTAVGFGAGGLVLAGYASTCSVGCSGALLGAGLGGVAVGVGGIIFTAVRLHRRKPYNLKLKELRQERHAIELDIDGVPLGAVGMVTYSF